MSSTRLPLSSRPSFLPDEIAKREFATVFRGYDPAEVRTFLNQLAEQSADLSDRVAEIQRNLADTESRAKNPELDEETVTRLLGSQTAQILRSAREAANEIRSKADEEVSRSLREAHEVTTKMREEAEALLAERTEEAERVAATIKATNEEEVDQLRSDTEAEMLGLRQQTQSDLVDERSRARAQMRDLIDAARAESQALVERTQTKQTELLDNLVRKRKIALAQVEELRAGRARLLDAYKMVRTTLDEVTVELGRAESEARDQASEAGQTVALASDLEVADLDEVVDLEQFRLDDDVSNDIIDLSDDDVAATSGPGFSYETPTDSDATATSATQTALLVDEREEDAEQDAAELREVAEQSDELVAQRSAVVTKASAQMMRRLQRSLQDERDAVVARLRNGQSADAEAIIGSSDDQIATHQRSVVRLFREVVRTGTSTADSKATIERSLSDHTGTSAAREFISEMVEDLRTQLVPVVDELLAETPEEAGDVARRVSDAYDSISGTHLATMLDERVGGAFDQGVAFAK